MSIEAGKIFKLKHEIEYKEGQAEKKIVLNLPDQKIFLVAIDKGLLPDHPAPLNALVFVLEGEGTITYLGKDFDVKEGDNFLFAKGAIHSVKTDKKLKLALVMTSAEL